MTQVIVRIIEDEKFSCYEHILFNLIIIFVFVKSY